MGPKAIDRMLALEPPREELDSLKAVWKDFKWRRLARGHRDPCIAFTADAGDLKEAIIRACDSRGEDGKLFFHQGRVWQQNRDEFSRVLRKKAVRKSLTKAKDFHEVWKVCQNIGGTTHGIGAITIYDVCARLCAYFEYPADRVYLHGGVLDGVRAVGIDPKGKVWVERAELPKCLRKHENLDEVEDFLCGYRVLIERVMS